MYNFQPGITLMMLTNDHHSTNSSTFGSFTPEEDNTSRVVYLLCLDRISKVKSHEWRCGKSEKIICIQ